MRQRIENVQPRTDDDVGDEAAGAARAEFAEKARKKREDAQAKLAAENAAYKARIKNTAARTDDDLLDDVGTDGSTMAQTREATAAASKASKDAKQADIDRENAAMRERIKNPVAAVDDDISDEAAGAARDEAGHEPKAASATGKKGFFGWGGK